MRFYCLILYACISLFSISRCANDESPGFFLKVTKNVPRLGRRSDKDFENSFMKNFKAIPRIGRNSNSNDDLSKLESWLSGENYFKQFNKRVLYNPARITSSEHELSVVQPVNSNTLIELLEKDAIPSDIVKFVHWKDFDLALQLDKDLYAKVMSLARRPDRSLKHDLNIGGYIPLFSRAPADNNENDFVLYGGANSVDEALNADLLRYNHI